MTLGKRIKNRREELRMTQKELADTVGTPQSHIAALESGSRKDVTGRTLRRFARALKCSADDLIGTFEELEESEAETKRAALVIVS